MDVKRGHSLAGKALRSQRRDRGFESRCLQYYEKPWTSRFFLLMDIKRVHWEDRKEPDPAEGGGSMELPVPKGVRPVRIGGVRSHIENPGNTLRLAMKKT